MKLKLGDIDTRAPKEFQKLETKQKTVKILEELNELQNLLYAERKHSLLVVLQGMDASGKDGLIRDVFGRLNPQGVMVKPYKAPTEEELSHDFLWRIHKHAPARGMIQIFNRSHYEDVVVTRVHKWCDDETAYKRMDAINRFERLLHDHNNTQVLKFYLHISPGEQKERLEERMHDPTKQWKYNEKDFEEAKMAGEYRRMYEECFERCNEFPWEVIPADQNWYKEWLVASRLKSTLEKLDMKYPQIKKPA